MTESGVTGSSPLAQRPLSRPAGERRATTWLLGAAALLFTAGVVVGLGLSTPANRPPSHLEQLTALLALRPEQVAALEQVFTAEDREVDALLQSSLEGLREPVALRRQQTEEQLLACLDMTQRARYEQLAEAGSLSDAERR